MSFRITSVLALASLAFGEVAPFRDQAPAPVSKVRVIILNSRHLGAHGLDYNDRSLTELAQKLSPADIPSMIALLGDSKIRVGAQFALAAQCAAGIAPVSDATRRRAMTFLDASDVLDLISNYQRCPAEAREQAGKMRVELDKWHLADEARAAAESRREAENDASIQRNAVKMMDPQRARELTREEREEVYHRSLEAMGIDEKGPLTADQKQMVDRMYRTMVLGQSNPSPNH